MSTDPLERASRSIPTWHRRAERDKPPAVIIGREELRQHRDKIHN